MNRIESWLSPIIKLQKDQAQAFQEDLYASTSFSALASSGAGAFVRSRFFFRGRVYQRWICPSRAACLCAAAMPSTRLDVGARLLGVWR